MSQGFQAMIIDGKQITVKRRASGRGILIPVDDDSVIHIFMIMQSRIYTGSLVSGKHSEAVKNQSAAGTLTNTYDKG